VKVLLDECVDWRLARLLSGHDVRTVQEMGWAAMRNGNLLALAEDSFDVFLTVDRNLSFQQSLPRFQIAVIVVCAATNRLQDLLPLVPRIINAIPTAKHGEVMFIGIEGFL